MDRDEAQARGQADQAGELGGVLHVASDHHERDEDEQRPEQARERAAERQLGGRRLAHRVVCDVRDEQHGEGGVRDQ